MHHDRKRIFVDSLKWNVPVVDGKYEKDQFDTGEAIYLMALDDKKQEHLGSVRLPATRPRPHLMGERLPDAVRRRRAHAATTSGRSRAIASARNCAARKPGSAQSYLAVGMVEFALLYGITHYTCLAEMSFLSTIMAVGWECEPLGLPQVVNGETVGALLIKITPATLQMFRTKMGWRHPILEVDAIAQAA